MEQNPPEHLIHRVPRPQQGLSKIVAMFSPQSKTTHEIQYSKLIQLLDDLNHANPKNEGFVFDFNVYELANVVIAQLRNLVTQGFYFKHKDNSLAYAIIRMIQINILWHCYQSKYIQQKGGQLTKGIELLIQQLKKDTKYCLYNGQLNLNKFELIEPSLKNLLEQVLLNKQKYLSTTSYHSYSQPSFDALHQIYLSILTVLSIKIKGYLLLPEKQKKQNLFYFCDRIYLKLRYLHVATNNTFNREAIRQLARTSEQHQKLASCIYLLDSGRGMCKLLNYFEQAPTGALINDKLFLKIRFKQTECFQN